MHVIRICEWGSKRREEDKFLTFKVSHILDAFFAFTRAERLREEKRTKAGRREGGGRW